MPVLQWLRFFAVLALLFLGQRVPLSADDLPIDFNRDIRPILSENCFHCHGPDDAARKGKLRLDLEELAKKERGGYSVIVPGRPGDSELHARIHSSSSDEQMPPPDSKRSLTESQKKLITRWIEEGAGYARHWSLVLPAKDVRAPKHGPSAIDHFVNAELARRKLTSVDEADKRTLIRRVSLDLTGLPPTVEEVDAFISDTSPGAWEKVVDRLLASPRFGEHWARPWLDLARYADSNGFQADQIRPSWAYRDWVINALNANMPFDQFTIEQLAGDLIPNSTIDQRIATGFHRTVTCNVEAGVHPEANRTNQVVDRVNTTATVWLGITMECSQCHHHKYDPFSMKDYYGLFAYFNNTPLEVELPSGVTDVSHDFIGPYMDLPLNAPKQAERERLQASVEKLKKQRPEKLEEGFEKWLAAARLSLRSRPQWQVLPVQSFSSSSGESFRVLDDQSVLLTGPVPDKTTYTITVGGRNTAKEAKEAKEWTAFKLEALTHDEIPGKGPGRGDPERTNFILNEITLSLGGKAIPLKSATADFSQKGWPVAGATDGVAKTGWAIAPQFGKDHWMTVRPESPVATKGQMLTFQLSQNYGQGRVIGRLRISAMTGDPSMEALPNRITKLLALPESKLQSKQRKVLLDHFSKSHPDISRLDAEIAKAMQALEKVKPGRTLVMKELEKPRTTHVLTRGDYLSPAEKVSTGTPSSLHPRDPALPSNRLGLAQWITSPANPLTARVTVNRWWAEIFGGGIVATLEDFGTQSDPPTHPGLLDWLAVDFMESGWDMKHVLKTIVLSKTYRRSSKLTPELIDRDPLNKYLARGARFRLSAESIRDNALAASGLLSTKTGGPPIMPYQPGGIWRAVGRNAPKWVTAISEDRFRRGIYVVWRRAAPYPSFVNFDAPDRAACTVKRPRTNTPLQALTLLNDPAWMEIALALADRAIVEAPGDPLRRAFQLLLSREPSGDERRILNRVLEERQSHFAEDPKKAGLMIEGAASGVVVPKTKDKVLLASYLHVANILLNLDETVTKE